MNFKNYSLYFGLFLAMLLSLDLLRAQTPQAFKYQAVVRDSAGHPIDNQAIGIRVSIAVDSATGTIVYQETHTATSNNFGLINLEIGSGTPSISTFSAIDWSSASHYLVMEIDDTGGTNYSPLMATQLLAVPFALYAENVANKDDADADPANEIQDMSLSGNTLSLTGDGTSVDLSALADGIGTDDQTLSLVNDSLFIEGGNGVPIIEGDGVLPSATSGAGTDPPTLIDGSATVISSIVLAGVGNFDTGVDISVCINITHPYVVDLNVYLRAPNGVRINLAAGNGGSGDNYTNTCFTNDATTSINAGSPPFTGNFIPEQAFSALYGSPIAGTWSLEMDDTFPSADDGTLTGWNISLNGAVTPYKWVKDNDNLIANVSGNVGIGMDPPAAKLHIGGIAGTDGIMFPDGTLQTTAGASDNLGNHTAIQNIQLSGNWLSGDGGNEGVFIASDGNVGIGATSPEAHLHIYNSTDPTLKLQSNGTGEISGRVSMRQSNNTGADIYYDGTNSSEHFAIEGFSGDTSEGKILVVDLDGNVGIGTTSPAFKLDVSGGDVKAGGDFITGANNGVINSGGAVNPLINVIGDAASPTITIVNGDEDLFIQDDLEVAGNGYKAGGGSWGGLSDARLKKDITPYTDGLQQLLQINPVRYSYNDRLNLAADDRKFVGIIAQDMQKVAPYMVEEKALGQKVREVENGVDEIIDPGENYLVYDGSALLYMLVNAVKELAADNEALKTQVEQLNNVVIELQSK